MITLNGVNNITTFSVGYRTKTVPFLRASKNKW